MILILSARLAWPAEKGGDFLIASFESEDELARWDSRDHSASIERVTEHATHGKYSARVTFRKGAGKYSGLRMNLCEQDGGPADWSRFRTLKLDVYSPFYAGRPPGHGRSSARIDFSLKDAKGNNWWHRCALSEWSSDQVIEVPLVTTMDKMSAIEDRPFEFGSVVSVAMSTKRPDEDLVLFFDNMRLLPKDGGEAEKALAPNRSGTGLSAQTIPERAARQTAGRTLGRDFTFTQFYHGPNYPYEEKGFFRLGKGPVVLRLSQPGYGATSADVPELERQILELRQRDIPFHVILFNFWGGRYETYQEATTRLRAAIAAFQAAGGDYFQAVWLHELEAMAWYRIVGEQSGRLAKANAYVQFLRKFIRDVGVPPGKLVIVNRGAFFNYGLDYEAGVDAVLPETLFQLDNVALCTAQARGMARSFGRWWGGDTARYSGGPATARYNRDGSTKPVTIDFFWWGVSDVYKAFMQHYYSGADILRGQSEWPARRPEDGPMFDHFLRFVESHPRAREVITRIAVVRSKGDYWAGANLLGSSQGLADWIKAEGTKQEELDYLYLNEFFPGFSDDGHTARSYWTSTPFGPIDIVYPSISLDGLRNYECLIFLGFHRMDSVRVGFLEDLTRYVEGGGTVLLAADHLRMSDEKFAPAPAIERLAGVEIAETTRPITGPIRVVENERIRFPKSRYDLPAVQARPVAYHVSLGTGIPLALDAQGVPLLVQNVRGKGRVLLLTTATLSHLPPRGKSEFVGELLRQVASSARRPVAISPPSDHVEFVMSKSTGGAVVVFLMNHERAEWTGEVTVDPAAAGVSAWGTPDVSLVVCRGYEQSQPEIRVSVQGNKTVVGGVTLPGGTQEFDPFRAASLAVLTIRRR